MRTGRRDPAVRRWLRRPAWWLAASFLIALVLFGADLFAFPNQQRAARGAVVEGWILGSWDGGIDVPVAYTQPGGGETVIAIARTTAPSDERVGPVEVRVDPQHPNDAHLGGFDQSQLLIAPLTALGPAVAAILLWWWTRRRRVRRSEALAVADVPSFRMSGLPRPGTVSPRRWRMHLYPLDAPPGADPVCSVAMIDGDDDLRPRLVEVKGQPRPGGEVVVWEPASNRVWWPAGRVLLTGRRKLATAGPYPVRPTHSPWRWIVPVVGFVVMVGALESGENRDLQLERSEVVAVTVVSGHGEATGPTVVSYRTVDGTDREATVVLAGPQRVGDRYRLRVDPDYPDRLWQPRTAEQLPGSEGPLVELIGTLALVVLIVGIIMVRRPRPRARPLRSLGLALPSSVPPPRSLRSHGPPPPPPPPPSGEP